MLFYLIISLSGYIKNEYLYSMHLFDIIVNQFFFKEFIRIDFKLSKA